MRIVLAEMQMDWICGTLNLSRNEILSVRSNPQSGRNNDTFILDTAKGAFLYRAAGCGTELFCNRENEKINYRRLTGFRLTDTLLGCEPATGAKLTVYYPNSQQCDPHDMTDCRTAMSLLRRFHEQKVCLEGISQPYLRLRDYMKKAARLGFPLEKYPPFMQIYHRLTEHQDQLIFHAEDELHPIHADAQSGNFLIKQDGTMILLDLEFSAMGCIYEDLADFCHGARFDEASCNSLLRAYFLREPTCDEFHKLQAYIVCVCLMWSAWAACKMKLEPTRSGMFEDYLTTSLQYAARALDFNMPKVDFQE